MTTTARPRSVRVHAYNNSAFTVEQQREKDIIQFQSSALEDDVGEVDGVTDNSDNDIDDVTDYSSLPLYEALKPLMFSMKLFGLHYVRLKPGSKNDQQNKDEFRRCCNCSCSGFQVYSWILAAVMWIYLFIFSTQVGTAGDRTMALAAQAWLLQSCLNLTCLVFASHHPKAMRKLFVSFARLRRYGGMLTSLSRIRSVINIIIGCLSVTCVVGVAVFFYVSYEFVAKFIFGGSPSINSTMSIVALSVTEVTWISINLFEVCICIILYREFCAANKQLKAKVRTDANLSTTFEMERRRFIEMTRAVSAADRTLALHHLSSFCCDIAILCLLIYKVIFDTKSDGAVNVMTAYWLWMLFTLADLMIICFCGTIIIMGMEKLKEPLHFIKLNNSYHSQFNIQVSMFFTKLNERIGLTVGSLFVVDQTAILSLIGMFITYFLLVVQFASLLLNPSSTTNSTISEPDQQRVLQERLQKWREEKANRKKQVDQRLGPSKPFAFRHVDQMAFNKPLAPLPPVKPVAAVMPQARTVRGAVSTSTVTAPSRANTIPAKTVAAAKGKVASKATDKPPAAATAPMDTAEPAARRVTRSQVTVAKPASGKKVTADKQTSVRAASGGRTNRTATATTSTSMDKPSSATQAKVTTSSKVQDKPSTSGSSTRGATRVKGKDADKGKVKEVECKAKAVAGKGLLPPPVNKGRGGKAATKVQTLANNASDTPVNQPTPVAVIGDTVITPDATPVDNGRVNFTRGSTSFAPEHHQFVAPEALAGSQFMYRAPENLLSMSFKPMSPASIGRFFGDLPLDNSSSKLRTPVARIKTPRRCTAQAAAHEQEQATDLTGSSQVDMTDHSHAITDSSLATPMTDSIPTVPMTESSHSDIAVTVLAVDANHSDMAAEVTEGVKAAKEEVPESVNSASGVQNSVEPMVTSDIGEVNQLAGNVSRLNLLSSESSYETATEFCSPSARPVFSSSSSNSTTRASTHRRSVTSTVPFRRRETQKLLQNSLILQSLSPEECVEILRNSPMVEMTRRRRTTMSPATPLTTQSAAAGDQAELPLSAPQSSVCSERSEAGTSTSSVGTDDVQDQPAPGTVPYYRKLIVDETGRLMALCCKWNRINEENDDLPEKVRGEIRSFIGQAELLMAQRFKQFASLIDNCEFKLGERETTCTDLQGFWEMIYCQVDDVNKKFDKLNMMHASNWQYSTPVLTTKTKKVTKASKKPAVTAQAAVSRFAAFRAAQKTTSRADTEQAPAVEAQESDTSVAAPEINTPELATATVDSVCGVEATSNIVLPVVGMTGDNAPVVVSQLGDVKEMTDDTMQPVASQVDGDADDMVLGDIVKEVPRRRTRKSHSVTFSAHASTRRSTRLSTAVHSTDDDDVLVDLVPVSVTLTTPSAHQQTPRMARNKRVSELLYSPVPETPSNTTPVTTATQGADLMCFTPSEQIDEDQPSAKMATRRSMNVGHTPYRPTRRSERRSLAH